MKAIISDVHGNTPALKAVLNDIQKRKPTAVYFLGDVINGPDPAGCLSLLRESCSHFVRGNAEEWLCDGETVIKYKPHDRIRIEASQFLNETSKMIQSEMISWLCSWPNELVEGSALFLHDSPYDRAMLESLRRKGDPNSLLYHGHGISRESPKAMIEANLAILQVRHIKTCFCGHTHEPSLSKYGDIQICNSGSVGLSLDGDWRPSWIMWDESSLSIRRVEYNVEEAIELFRHAPEKLLIKRYEKALRTGTF